MLFRATDYPALQAPLLNQDGSLSGRWKWIPLLVQEGCPKGRVVADQFKLRHHPK